MSETKKKPVNSEDLEIEGSSEIQYVNVDGVRIRLARPMDLPFQWVGAKKVVDQLRACWFMGASEEQPMNPRLVGKPGVGKTVLAYCAGEMLKLPVFFFQATLGY